ncbi:hypothetical protein J6590_056839 [Homalodisca vitripennis]|nr:hypothetical protein J6590_056839 [Homalodisca vitripennis]
MKLKRGETTAKYHKDRKIKKLSKIEMETWLCVNCKCNNTIETKLENLLENNTSTQPQSTMEDVHTKIQHFENTDDLETSLTLAAEAGNALLAENNKLRQDLHALTLRNSQLAKQISNLNTLSELTYQAKIEELESQNESLLSRNAMLTDALTEIENQLLKEKQLQVALEKTFEEQDASKEKIIDILEGKIKQLEDSIKKLNSTKKYIYNKEEATAIDSGTQTKNLDTPKPSDTSHILVELTKLKCRHDHMESTINDLKCKLQNTMTPAELTYKTSPAKQPLSPNCTNKKFKKQGSKKQNIFSISLQVAKNKELQEIKKHKNETVKKTPANKIAKEFGTFRVQAPNYSNTT